MASLSSSLAGDAARYCPAPSVGAPAKGCSRPPSIPSTRLSVMNGHTSIWAQAVLRPPAAHNIDSRLRASSLRLLIGRLGAGVTVVSAARGRSARGGTRVCRLPTEQSPVPIPSASVWLCCGGLDDGRDTHGRRPRSSAGAAAAARRRRRRAGRLRPAAGFRGLRVSGALSRAGALLFLQLAGFSFSLLFLPFSTLILFSSILSRCSFSSLFRACACPLLRRSRPTWCGRACGPSLSGSRLSLVRVTGMTLPSHGRGLFPSHDRDRRKVTAVTAVTALEPPLKGRRYHYPSRLSEAIIIIRVTA